jgi:hypothetical protein
MKKTLIVALIGVVALALMASAHELKDADGNLIAHTHYAYDLNQDGKVDMKDIVKVARAFGSVVLDPKTGLPSPNWNPVADINQDGVVDMRDLRAVAKYFGQIGYSIP